MYFIVTPPLEGSVSEILVKKWRVRLSRLTLKSNRHLFMPLQDICGWSRIMFYGYGYGVKA